MNRSAERSRISLVIVLAALFWPKSPVGAQNPASTPAPTAAPQHGEVMALVRQEINRTQQTVREVYGRLELLTRKDLSGQAG